MKMSTSTTQQFIHFVMGLGMISVIPNSIPSLAIRAYRSQLPSRQVFDLGNGTPDGLMVRR